MAITGWPLYLDQVSSGIPTCLLDVPGKNSKKIIKILRSHIFNFLWNSHLGHFRFHLCSWDILSKPRRNGGWGLMNLSTFNTALLANSFWRAVSIDSIWHRIIADKYLGSLPLGKLDP
jgi:hypothetical protein